MTIIERIKENRNEEDKQLEQKKWKRIEETKRKELLVKRSRKKKEEIEKE